jgi:23S rRNA (adenine2503-C2)-methyltransferase
MNLSKLDKILSGEPKYRSKQIQQAIFRDLVGDWEEVKTLPKQLRENLQKNCPLDINAQIFHSRDGRTSKALVILVDGNKIETVLMRHEGDRHTACVSCQVGCPLACTFCATGRLGLKRNLTADEIVEQVLLWNRVLKGLGEKDRITNVVYMGMGEPFLNYSNVMSSIQTLNNKDGLNIGARKISISTSGIVPKIKKLALENIQVNLALSLHAPNDALRSQLMPVNKHFPLATVMDAIDYYISKTNRKVMFEYLMIDGVNDSLDQAKELAVLLKRPLVMVNLIAYNPTNAYQPAKTKNIQIFKEYLEKEGLFVIQRFTFGQDIKAACGQLALEN